MEEMSLNNCNHAGISTELVKWSFLIDGVDSSTSCPCVNTAKYCCRQWRCQEILSGGTTHEERIWGYGIASKMWKGVWGFALEKFATFLSKMCVLSYLKVKVALVQKIMSPLECNFGQKSLHYLIHFLIISHLSCLSHK